MMKPDPEFESFLRDQADLHDLSRSEWQAFVLAITGDDIATIAEKLQANESAIRQRLSQVYKKFGVEGRGPVKLNKLQQLIRLRSRESDDRSETIFSQESANVKRDRLDWGEAPDLRVFYGRAEDLDTLERWVVGERCRLVGLVGFGGIGKTTLARKLAERVEGNFDRLIWRSVRNAPPLDRLLDELLEFLCGASSGEKSADVDGKISRVLDELKQSRYLIILDEVENILKSGDLYGRYESGYEKYSDFFQRLADINHQSCTIAISRDNIKDITLRSSPQQPIRDFKLEGLDGEDARKIFQEQGLQGNTQEQNQLIEMYSRNPLALNLVSKSIQETFEGNISEFLKLQTVFVDGSLNDIIESSFRRLSDEEKEIIKLLAEFTKSLSFQSLKNSNPKFEEHVSELIRSIESLSRRSLIEKTREKTADRQSEETRYSLQPIVKKYVMKFLSLKK